MDKFLIPLIPILILYPYFVTKIMNKRIKENKHSKTEILESIISVIIFTAIISVLILPLLGYYDTLNPDSSSNLCTNSGGFSYSCLGDLKYQPIIILLILALIIVHHIFTYKSITKIFENKNNLFNYIFMYIYFIVIYVLSFFLLISLYGLFVSIHFNSFLVEALRLIVLISPLLSFIIHELIIKIKSKE